MPAINDIFQAVAASSTNTYKSRVSDRKESRHFYNIQPTGTLTGTLGREVNDLPDEDYRAAVAAASGANDEEKEANNTVGWVAQSFLQSDVTNASATFAINGTTSFTANMPPGPRRSRLTYTNATNTGSPRTYLTTHRP